MQDVVDTLLVRVELDLAGKVKENVFAYAHKSQTLFCGNNPGCVPSNALRRSSSQSKFLSM